MTVINPYLAEMNFREKIAILASAPIPPPIATVLQAFNELESDQIFISGLQMAGRILLKDGSLLASIEYPDASIPAAHFASDNLCSLYNEVLTAVGTTPMGDLEQITLKFTDTYIFLIPLAIEGICLVDIFES